MHPEKRGRQSDENSGCWYLSMAVSWVLSTVGFLVLVFKYHLFSNAQPHMVDAAVQYWHRTYSLLKIFGFAIGSLLLLSTGGQLLLSRWKRLVVFISYQHDAEPIAAQIAASLKNHHVESIYQPYQPGEHDVVVEEVRRMIRSSDAVVAIPGPVRSFVDAEILAASVREKPIIFIKRADGETLPDTALKGYPVFRYTCVSRQKFAPLSRFIKFACNHWTDALRNILRVSASLVPIAVTIGFVIALLDFIADFANVILLLFVGLESMFWVDIGEEVIFLFSFAVATAVVITLAIWRRTRAIRVCRQKIISGNLTYKILSDGLGPSAADQAIIDCLEKEPLMPRHPNPARDQEQTA